VEVHDGIETYRPPTKARLDVLRSAAARRVAINTHCMDARSHEYHPHEYPNGHLHSTFLPDDNRACGTR